jgi:hypothetical protein
VVEDDLLKASISTAALHNAKKRARRSQFAKYFPRKIALSQLPTIGTDFASKRMTNDNVWFALCVY